MSFRNAIVSILLIVVAVVVCYQGYTFAVPQIGPGSAHPPIGTAPPSGNSGDCFECSINLIDDPLVPAQEAGVLVDLNTPQLDAYGQPMRGTDGEPVYVRI